MPNSAKGFPGLGVCGGDSDHRRQANVPQRSRLPANLRDRVAVPCLPCGPLTSSHVRTSALRSGYGHGSNPRARASAPPVPHLHTGRLRHLQGDEDRRQVRKPPRARQSPVGYYTYRHVFHPAGVHEREVEALLICEGLEALLVPPDGRLDISGDEINVGERAGGKPTRSGHPESVPTPTGQASTVNLRLGITHPSWRFPLSVRPKSPRYPPRVEQLSGR